MTLVEEEKSILLGYICWFMDKNTFFSLNIRKVVSEFFSLQRVISGPLPSPAKEIFPHPILPRDRYSNGTASLVRVHYADADCLPHPPGSSLATDT